MKTKRIFLVGYMGVGKTTIGESLAKRLNVTFIDLDHYIETRFHKTVSGLFEERGEDGFRHIEYNMLHEVAMFEDILISTGGGTPCFFNNMEFMNSVGKTVYLKASPEELTRRLQHSYLNKRPVLGERTGDDLFNFISETLEKRTPFYTMADIVFDTEQMYTYNDMQNEITVLDGLLKDLEEEKI